MAILGTDIVMNINGVIEALSGSSPSKDIKIPATAVSTKAPSTSRSLPEAKDAAAPVAANPVFPDGCFDEALPNLTAAITKAAKKNSPAPSKEGVSLLKKLVALTIVLALGVLGVLAYAQHAPNGKVANTVTTCASRLGVPLDQLQAVGKSLHTPIATAAAAGAQAASAGAEAAAEKFREKVSEAFAGEQFREKVSAAPAKTEVVEKTEVVKISSENIHAEGLVESIAMAAGAAITSTVGYGLYWLMTQG